MSLVYGKMLLYNSPVRKTNPHLPTKSCFTSKTTCFEEQIVEETVHVTSMALDMIPKKKARNGHSWDVGPHAMYRTNISKLFSPASLLQPVHSKLLGTTVDAEDLHKDPGCILMYFAHFCTLHFTISIHRLKVRWQWLCFFLLAPGLHGLTLGSNVSVSQRWHC